MSRREIPDLPEGWLIALVAVLVFFLFVLALLFFPPKARAAELAEQIRPGMVCQLPGAWYSTTAADPAPSRTEPVLVVALKPIPATAEPGAWIKPMRGPLTWAEYQVQASRLQECRQ